MPKSPYIGVTITIGYKCHSRGVITKLISHTHTCTNRKAGVHLMATDRRYPLVYHYTDYSAGRTNISKSATWAGTKLMGISFGCVFFLKKEVCHFHEFHTPCVLIEKTRVVNFFRKS